MDEESQSIERVWQFYQNIFIEKFWQLHHDIVNVLEKELGIELTVGEIIGLKYCLEKAIKIRPVVEGEKFLVAEALDMYFKQYGFNYDLFADEMHWYTTKDAYIEHFRRVRDSCILL